MKALTDTVLMVRPANFGCNPETVLDNSFQKEIKSLDYNLISENAIQEFDALVKVLESHKINVEVFHDTKSPIKPDAVFPNNWISFHSPNKVITYPMKALNRRYERREHIIKILKKKYLLDERLHFESFELKDEILEGTGSMIFDRESNIAYACKSSRSSEYLFNIFCEQLGFQPVFFEAFDLKGIPFYHTNVMMAMGTNFVVICLDSIKAPYREKLEDTFARTGKTIINISQEQVLQFAGNMIQLKNIDNHPYLVMSSTAYRSLTDQQLNQLNSLTGILHSDVTTIETYGGGSVRCMIAEIFKN